MYVTKVVTDVTKKNLKYHFKFHLMVNFLFLVFLSFTKLTFYLAQIKSKVLFFFIKNKIDGSKSSFFLYTARREQLLVILF